MLLGITTSPQRSTSDLVVPMLAVDAAAIGNTGTTIGGKKISKVMVGDDTFTGTISKKQTQGQTSKSDLILMQHL